VVLNSVVVLAVSLLFSQLLLPRSYEFLGNGTWVRLLNCVVALTMCIPFIRAIIIVF
jgi:hypothetical protein